MTKAIVAKLNETTLARAISAATRKAIALWGQKDSEKEKAEEAAVRAVKRAHAAGEVSKSFQTAMVDSLIADGIDNPEYLKGKGKGRSLEGNSPLYLSVRDAVILSFTPAVQELLTADIATLTKAEKARRSKYSQQIGSKVAKIRVALDERVNPKDKAKAKAEDKATRGAKSPVKKEEQTSAEVIVSPVKRAVEQISSVPTMLQREVKPSQMSAALHKKIQKQCGDLCELINQIG